MLSLERTPEPWTAAAALIPSSAAQPVNPACFSRRKIDAGIDLVAGTSWRGPNRVFQVMQFNAPTLQPEPIPARFLRPKRPGNSEKNSREFRADKPITRCLNRRSEWSFRNPFGMTGGDPKHTRAEQEES